MATKKKGAYSLTVKLIPEMVVPGKRLGRHFVKDSRSALYRAEDFLEKEYLGALHYLFGGTHGIKTPTSAVLWNRHCPPFDQGDIGSCTGNAIAGLLMTDPFWVPGRAFTEDTALAFYEAATALDSISGQYPPTDTGSTGEAAAQAALNDKYLSKYLSTSDLNTALASLASGPIIIGVNWYESFDSPDSTGQISIAKSAMVRGGHEIEVLGNDPTSKEVMAVNSWGLDWGDKGTFRFSYDTFAQLLSEDGDVTVGVKP